MLLDEILTAHPEVDFVQLQINYADWENPAVTSRANYETVRRHGKSIVVMEPVKGGTLANPPEKVKEIDIAKARRIYAKLRDFLAETQISSSIPKFDGAWMRAYDMDIDEYYGLDKDKGWGAYCIETGWMTGYIPLVFMYEGEQGSYFFR